MLFRMFGGLCAAGLIVCIASAQTTRITGRIDNTQRITLRGHLHPKAIAANDQGRVSPSLSLSYVTVNLTQTAAQQADLQQFLVNQQTEGSPDYHRWLTPEQYADRFGGSQQDIDTLSGWLQSNGLKVVAVARGRNWIAFDGMAAQVETAFQTEIHHYMVDGELHFANSTEPSVPAAFDSTIQGIHGLNDFRMKPSNLKKKSAPDYTSSQGNFIAPNDLATIYDINPLYSSGTNGSGQTMVVAGQTDVNLSDIETFRTRFNLPANDPKPMLVPSSRDPGVSQNDLPEADLDLEWAGAVARNATILYVYGTDVMTAVQYAIDQNLAPVVTESYGSCEPETLSSDMNTFRSWAQQGNAQGITWFAPSGDNGGADCDDDQNPGLAVDTPASVPEVTGVGGTEFNEGSGVFWNATNDPNSASVLSYIPETTWNDSVADGTPSASGGGKSIMFSKPTWQTGPGVPADNARDVPDVSLNASADHDGYMVYTGGQLQIYGGTSVPTPMFGGIATLLNQYLVSSGTQSSPGLGNINPHLYALAQTNPGAFHDVTTGNNIVTVNCGRRRGICSNPAVGYNAGVAYDQATGLGSIDVNNFITGWSGAAKTTPSNAASMTLLSNLNTLGGSDVMYLVATVTGTGGVTPTGSVTFEGNGSSLGTPSLVGSAGVATATLSITGNELQAGSGTITASYSGGSNSPSASVNVTVSSSGSVSNATPSISALANAASYKQAFAPGGILAVFGSGLAPSPQTAGSVPLPMSMAGVAALVNGVAAPLYYVGPGLVNVQIPYQTTAGPATVSINNNGKVATQSFTVAAVAPGIFMDANGAVVPTTSASRGQQIAIYITGAGAVSPAVSTGGAPASSTALADLPKPVQSLIVTVGGVAATVAFLGTPPGLVGVTQINFVVPTGIGTGALPVVVSVGGIPSASATLTITN